MPPRFVYWTILAGGLPTAFRATEREELLPTFKRILEKHPDAEMKYFARGRLWGSPEEARAARDQPPSRQSRKRDWRPGGEHRDPRQKFVDAKKNRNLRWRKERHDRKNAPPREKPYGDPLAKRAFTPHGEGSSDKPRWPAQPPKGPEFRHDGDPPRREFKRDGEARPPQRPPFDRNGGSRPPKRPPFNRDGGSRAPKRAEFRRDSGPRPPKTPEFSREGPPRREFERDGESRPPQRPPFDRDGRGRPPKRPPFNRDGGSRAPKRAEFRRDSGPRPPKTPEFSREGPPRREFKRDGESRPPQRPPFDRDGGGRPPKRPPFVRDGGNRPPKRPELSGKGDWRGKPRTPSRKPDEDEKKGRRRS